MVNPVVRKLRIVANTSSSTEAFARRTNELSKFVSGISRQSTELVRYISGEKHLTLIKTHPDQKERSEKGRITRYTLPLIDTIKTRNPNNIYRKSSSLDELRFHFRQLIKEMAEIVKDADVVLLGGTYFVPWALLQAARMHCKPVVLCYAGILSMEIKHLPDGLQSVLKRMEKDFYDPRIFYIFPSELTRRTVQHIFGKDLPHSEVVYNGVPLEFLAIRGRSEKRIPIAFVGRNTPVKNPQFLIELARAFERLRLSHRIHMVTKVDPTNIIIRDLKKLGVVVLEPLSTQKLAEFYSSTNVVVSPSHFETFGNVPLEAVSTGTPALISSAMGVSEVFSRLGMASYVTEFQDPYIIALRLDEFIKKKEKVPNHVRERIKQEFNWPAVIGRYLEICTSQVENEPSRGLHS